MGRERTRELTWIALLGLVACSNGTSSTGGSSSGTTPTYAPDHPCYGKSNCSSYVRLPDGGATTVSDGGAGDAGTVAMCGPCNG